MLLPVSQWLLCVWQAREARAPWWAVLLAFLGVQMSKMILEKRGKNMNMSQANRGWPELLRAAVWIALSVYTVQRMLKDIEPSGRITGMALMLLVITGIVDYDLLKEGKKRQAKLLHGLLSLAATVGIFLREWGAPSDRDEKAAFPWREWLQFLMSVQGLVIGHETAGADAYYVRVLCILGVGALATRREREEGVRLRFLFFLLLFPALCLNKQYAVSGCITPVLDQICLPELYPIADPKKAEARRILVAQQKQEILVYVMAWCVVLGLWAHLRPTTVLTTLQILGACLYLASLRRYSSAMRLRKLFFSRPVFHIKPSPNERPAASEPRAAAPTTTAPTATTTSTTTTTTSSTATNTTVHQRIASATIAATHARAVGTRDLFARMMTSRAPPSAGSNQC